MNILKAFFPCLLLLLGGCDATNPESAGSTDSLFGYRWNGTAEEIIAINEITGETKTLATLNLEWVLNKNFVVEPAGERAFLLGRRETDPERLSRLFTINLRSGEVSEVQLQDSSSVKFRAVIDGQLLGYRLVRQSHLEILEIDPSNGSVELSGVVDLQTVVNNGFEVDEVNERVYIIGNKNQIEDAAYIYTIDFKGEVVSEVRLNNNEDTPFIFGIDAGRLLGYRSKEVTDGRYNQLVTEVVEINPQSGAITVLSIYDFHAGLNLATGLTAGGDQFYTLGRLDSEAPIRLYIAAVEEGDYRSVILNDTGVGGFYIASKN